VSLHVFKKQPYRKIEIKRTARGESIGENTKFPLFEEKEAPGGVAQKENRVFSMSKGPVASTDLSARKRRKRDPLRIPCKNNPGGSKRRGSKAGQKKRE